MLEEINDVIKEEILVNNNKKIKEESLDEYLRSFKTKELIRLAVLHIQVDKDYKDLFKIQNLSNKPKKYIIDYITCNLDKILRCYIKIITKKNLGQIKKIISKQDDVNYNMYKLNLSFHTILFLKSFALAKVEYTKKTNFLRIYIPLEFRMILEKYLNDSNLLNENKRFNIVCDYVEAMLDIYGVILFSELHDIFEKQIFKIDAKDLEHIIESKCIVDDLFNIYPYDGDKLICDITFTLEDDALDFYENQKGFYKRYGKKTLEMIKNDTYVENLNSYKKFVNYLCRNFDNISEDIETIKQFIVLDYIDTAQISKEEANNNFNNNINKLFELDEKELEEMRYFVCNIYDEYPKWKKRGNV